MALYFIFTTNKIRSNKKSEIMFFQDESRYFLSYKNQYSVKIQEIRKVYKEIYCLDANFSKIVTITFPTNIYLYYL